MTRRLVIESSEDGRQEINYSTMPVREISSRIRSYEKKYGSPFPQFLQSYNCDNATPQEITDYMDWKNLVRERSDRNITNGRKSPAAKR